MPRKAGEDAVAARRAVLACAVVLMIVLSPLLPGVVAHCAGGAAREASIARGSVFAVQETLLGVSAEQVVDRLLAGTSEPWAEGAVSPELPMGIPEDVRLPKGAMDVRVNEELAVVCYEWDESEGDAVDALASSMGGAGWRSLPLGSMRGCSFIRDDDAGRCIVATATFFGDARSAVVLRVVR